LACFGSYDRRHIGYIDPDVLRNEVRNNPSPAELYNSFNGAAAVLRTLRPITAEEDAKSQRDDREQLRRLNSDAFVQSVRNGEM
jgi:hypothetical protein